MPSRKATTGQPKQAKPDPAGGAPRAYLVTREGAKWSDVYRLQPGRTVTLGRAQTNRIVIKNDRASRQHAEIFSTEAGWVIRDLQSRNGTWVGDVRIQDDHLLQPGDIIRIAHYQLAFVYDLEDAYGTAQSTRGESLSTAAAPGRGTTDLSAIGSSEEDVLVVADEPLITHRRDRTRFLSGRAETACGRGDG